MTKLTIPRGGTRRLRATLYADLVAGDRRDLSGLSAELPGALVAALTLLSLRGLIEQRGGRWRRVLGAVLRSRP